MWRREWRMTLTTLLLIRSSKKSFYSLNTSSSPKVNSVYESFSILHKTLCATPAESLEPGSPLPGRILGIPTIVLPKVSSITVYKTLWVTKALKITSVQTQEIDTESLALLAKWRTITQIHAGYLSPYFCARGGWVFWKARDTKPFHRIIKSSWSSSIEISCLQSSKTDCLRNVIIVALSLGKQSLYNKNFAL